MICSFELDHHHLIIDLSIDQSDDPIDQKTCPQVPCYYEPVFLKESMNIEYNLHYIVVEYLYSLLYLFLLSHQLFCPKYAMIEDLTVMPEISMIVL